MTSQCIPPKTALQDTICAIATPAGKGGVGIVKISGSKALHLGRSVFYKKEGAVRENGGGEASAPTSEVEFRPRHMYHGFVREKATGRVVDEVLYVYMKGPHSYTGEDVVEIQAHGGAAALETIIKMVLQGGGRCAEPGEFTLRAFLNGRIDLTQAEGVIDLINAKSASALKMAAKQVAGALGGHIHDLRARILNLITLIEAGIDFPDEIGSIPEIDRMFAQIQGEVMLGIRQLIRRHEQGRVFREGFRLTLVGRPNVGKSSLLNTLLGWERAIVTDIPGTTRDLIHERLSINGASIVLTDTAGIQATDNPIERIGIEKTKGQLASSDLILFVVDAQNGIGGDEIEWFKPEHRPKLLVAVNKVDLKDNAREHNLPGAFGGLPMVCVSAKTGFGIEALWGAIQNRLFEGLPTGLEEEIVPNLRQKEALQNTLTCLASAVQAYREDVPLEMIAIDLQEALRTLGSVVGINVREDVLGCIFKEFCIGK